MGGSGGRTGPARVTAADLITHPSFEMPGMPDVHVTPKTFRLITDYALECAARMTSPSPKEDGEDEEFACDDLAQAIRNLKLVEDE